MLEELRFAVWCFGKDTKTLKKSTSMVPDKSLEAEFRDGPNGTLTPLTSTYTDNNSVNHKLTKYGLPDTIQGNYA